MNFNVPTNSLNIANVHIIFQGAIDPHADGTLTTEQFNALLSAIAALCPPPIGTKAV